MSLHAQLLEELPTTILPPLQQSSGWSPFRSAASSSELVYDRVMILQTYLSKLLERHDTKHAEALFEFLELNSVFQLLAHLAAGS
jgi:hypothetical protein